jgi:hypothetical protein
MKWCVFLFNIKYGLTVLDTDLTEEEAKRQVQHQVEQGEKDVQRLSHGEFTKLFGQPPKVKE